MTIKCSQSEINSRRVLKALSVLLLSATALSAHAQVPTTDAARLGEESKTQTCMQRARTYKKKTEAPSAGVKASLTTPSDGSNLRQAGTDNITGSSFSGTSIGGVDLSGVLASGSGNGIPALKGSMVGQIFDALHSVSNAVQQNTTTLSTQGAAIGSANSVQGAFEQNSSERLSGASLWGQAIQSGTTRIQMQNQQLLDQTTAASAASQLMQYDPSKATLIDGDEPEASNREIGSLGKTSFDEIQQDLQKLQEQARQRALKNIKSGGQ